MCGLWQKWQVYFVVQFSSSKVSYYKEVLDKNTLHCWFILNEKLATPTCSVLPEQVTYAFIPYLHIKILMPNCNGWEGTFTEYLRRYFEALFLGNSRTLFLWRPSIDIHSKISCSKFQLALILHLWDMQDIR